MVKYKRGSKTRDVIGDVLTSWKNNIELFEGWKITLIFSVMEELTLNFLCDVIVYV